MNRHLTRELALLAAKLHLLKTQRHTLSDLSDIKEFRLLEELFKETVDLTSRDGSVPTDPIAALKSDWQRLSDWNEYVSNWLFAADEMETDAHICHKNPSYQTLVEIQSKLTQWPGTLQEAMNYARNQINEDDWVEYLPHIESIQIATIMGWDDSLKTPRSKIDLKIVENDLGKISFSKTCLSLVISRYAVNEGSQLIERRLDKFESLLQKTVNLLGEHSRHQSILSEVVSLTCAGQFQSARHLISKLSLVRFNDLIYTDAEISLDRLEEKIEKNAKVLSDICEQIKQLNEQSEKFYLIPPIYLLWRFSKIKMLAEKNLVNSQKCSVGNSYSEESQVFLQWRNAIERSLQVLSGVNKPRLIRSIYILIPIWIAALFLFVFSINFIINMSIAEQQRYEAAKKTEAERIEAAKKAEAERIDVAKKAQAEQTKANRIALAKKTIEKRIEWTFPHLFRSGYSQDQMKQLLIYGGKVKCWDRYGLEKPIGSNLTDIVDIQIGYKYLLLLKNDGTVLELNESNESQSVPEGLSGVVSIASGSLHRLALFSDGKVVAWGYSENGRTNVPNSCLHNVVAIDACGDYSLALKSDGTVIAWGQDSQGRTNVPRDLKGVVAISAGPNHSSALLNNGQVVTWGVLQGPAREPSATWNLQFNGSHATATSITLGYDSNLAVLSNGALLSWTDNGNGLSVPQFPRKVISAAINKEPLTDRYSMAIFENGSVIAWDHNGRSFPIPGSLSGVIALRAGGNYNYAITSQP